MNFPALAVLLALAASVVAGCSDDAKVSDITIVRAYFVACDSVLKWGSCYGPSHQAGTEEFTVIMSRNEVRRSNIWQFKGCMVTAPRRWVCLDSNDSLVTMQGDAVRWSEISKTNEVAVGKRTFCFADERKGKKSGIVARLRCLL